jgi:hypothetical protein
VVKAEEGTPLKKPTCRWDCNIKIDLKQKEWEGVLDSYGSG